MTHRRHRNSLFRNGWFRIGLTGALFLFLALLISPPATAQERREFAPEQIAALTARLQAHLDSVHTAGSFPGANAAVRLPDGTVIALSTGVNDRETGTPLTPADRMPAGSVGKTFFGAVALQLVHEGKLDLDAPISRYLGTEEWFPRLPNSAGVTVRMLMNHSSGIVRYEFNPRFLQDLLADPWRVWRPEDEIAYLFGSEAPFAAGEGWTYSDTNYIILAMIMERITGENIYHEIQRRILNPLGYTDTVPSDRPEIPRLAQGYAGANNPFGGRDAMLDEGGRLAINPQFEWAGGGFASTARELARWVADIYEGRVWDPALLEAVTDGLPARELGRGVRYGLTTIIHELPAGTAWGHSGYFPGYLTEMYYFPGSGVSVAVQVNTSVARAVGQSVVRIVNDLAALSISSLTAGLLNRPCRDRTVSASADRERNRQFCGQINGCR